MVIMTDEEDDPDDGDEEEQEYEEGVYDEIMTLVKKRTPHTTTGEEWPPCGMGSIGSSGNSRVEK